MSHDLAIAALAVRQHGNVTRWQLLAIGLDDDNIGRRVRDGRLHRVYLGVYAVGRRPVTPLERASAAVLACGPTAMLSHGSAMSLWGYFSRWDAPFEVTVIRDRRPRGITVHRSKTLTRSDVGAHFGIRVTSPARTLFDVAPRLSDTTRTRVVNDALLSPYLHENALPELLSRFPSHDATRLLRPFIGEDYNPSRSGLEDDFLTFCEQHNLPRPKTNVRVAGYLVDAYFPDHGLIVELDGWNTHGRRTTFESDRDRDADTLLAGLATVRITRERIPTSPLKEAERLRRILEQRRGYSGSPWGRR